MLPRAMRSAALHHNQTACHRVQQRPTVRHLCLAFMKVVAACALLMLPVVPEASAEAVGTQVLAVATTEELMDAVFSEQANILITEHLEFPLQGDGTETIIRFGGREPTTSVRVRASLPSRGFFQRQALISDLRLSGSQPHAGGNDDDAGGVELTRPAILTQSPDSASLGSSLERPWLASHRQMMRSLPSWAPQ